MLGFEVKPSKNYLFIAVFAGLQSHSVMFAPITSSRLWFIDITAPISLLWIRVIISFFFWSIIITSLSWVTAIIAAPSLLWKRRRRTAHDLSRVDHVEIFVIRIVFLERLKIDLANLSSDFPGRVTGSDRVRQITGK